MNASEIRELSTDDLRSKMNDARHELMNLRFQIITGQLTDTSRLKVSRRLIARYETLLHEREQAEEGSK
jgi:large subunit ribosomal protein L29